MLNLEHNSYRVLCHNVVTPVDCHIATLTKSHHDGDNNLTVRKLRPWLHPKFEYQEVIVCVFPQCPWERTLWLKLNTRKGCPNADLAWMWKCCYLLTDKTQEGRRNSVPGLESAHAHTETATVLIIKAKGLQSGILENVCQKTMSRGEKKHSDKESGRTDWMDEGFCNCDKCTLYIYC